MASRITECDHPAGREVHVFREFLPEGDEEGYAAPLTQYSIEESGDVLLARLILAQAAHDARGLVANQVRACARAYLTNWSEGLEIVCEAARIDLDYLIETFTKEFTWTPFPEDYERAFKRTYKWRAPRRSVAVANPTPSQMPPPAQELTLAAVSGV